MRSFPLKSRSKRIEKFVGNFIIEGPYDAFDGFGYHMYIYNRDDPFDVVTT